MGACVHAFARVCVDGCFMWFETKHLQPTHYCTLVQETKPYGSWVSANKCRWKSANCKKIRNLQNPVRMWPYGVLGVKRCFGNGICTTTFVKTTPMITTTVFSSISMYPHERDCVKSLFENPGKALTFKCPKNDKNPHDCDCVL